MQPLGLFVIVLTTRITGTFSNCFTSGGEVCRFPFIYEGLERSSCITNNDPEGKLWCSTRTNSTNHHVLGNWGHCAPSCRRPCTTSTGSPGTCRPPEECIGVDLQFLQKNVCPGQDRSVCCVSVNINRRVSFSPPEAVSNSLITDAEDAELERLLSEVEAEVAAEEAEEARETELRFGVGLRFGSPTDPPGERRPSSFHNKFNKPRLESKLLDKTSTILQKVTKKISEKSANSSSSGIGLRSGITAINSRSLRNKCPWLPAPACDPRRKYRSHDGTCNNLRKPNYGRTGTPYQRIMLPDYGPGSIDVPRKRSSDSFELPSARSLSNAFSSGGINKLDQDYTLLLMQMGQFIDHDITHTPIYESTECCRSKGRFPRSFSAEKCFPIRVSKQDKFWRGDTDCMDFSRSLSSPDLECRLTDRQQLNQVSHWLDGSNIYGSTEEESSRLRASNGLLRVSGTEGNNLPTCGRRTRDLTSCDTCSGPQNTCFFAGDSRVNEQPNLIVVHTLFMREHNRLVGILAELNPGWDGERLYEEARRINVAQYQHIIYKEWLPIVLGNTMMKTFGLLTLSDGFSTDYDDNFDPRINNEFAAAAFRFGHSLVSGSFVMKPSGMPQQILSLKETFFRPVPLNSSRIFDGLVRGLTEEETRAWDADFVSDIRNHLFESSKNSGGLDLVAMNIQRGRDHGVPGYVKYLQICTGRTEPIRNWSSLREFMEPDYVIKLQKMYKEVGDVDLFVGGFLERPHEDSMIGPVFKCIIGDQFARLKKGDRFFYDLGTAGPGIGFTAGQLAEVRRASLARLICENTAVGTIQPFPLQMPISLINSRRSCEELMSIRTNWTVFKE